jgi:DNA polymerase
MARSRPRAEGQEPQAIQTSAQSILPVEIEETPSPISSTALLSNQDSLDKVAIDLQGCTRCKLCEQRKNVVVGEGNLRAKLVFVGEGPGEQEDIQARPFVGKAGQLLDRMICAMGLQRSDVYIVNVVKCRPPGNRNPELDEIEACSPFLHRQLDSIQPQVVVALGKFAAQTLLQTDERITRLRGRFFQYRGAKLMPTFHPAFLLRNPNAKREAWQDLKAVAHELGLALPVHGKVSPNSG